MNFSDDLEDNLNVMIKWLTVASLVAIVIWCLISVVRFIMPKSEVKKTPVNTEIINEDFTGAEAGDEAVRELLGLDEDDQNGDEDITLMLDSDEVQAETNGNHTFSVNVKAMPEKLYFATISNNEMQVRKRQIINQKVGENYIDSVLSYGSLERWNPTSFPLKVFIQKPVEVPASHINEVKNAIFALLQPSSIFFVYIPSFFLLFSFSVFLFLFIVNKLFLNIFLISFYYSFNINKKEILLIFIFIL